MSPHLEALSAGSTLVTANARSARELALAHDRQHAHAGHAAWDSADILPWSAWLERCWHELVNVARDDEPVLLSAAQEEFLWERIIESTAEAGALLNISGAATEAMGAYALLHSWGLSLTEPAFALFEDPAAFQLWARQFDHILKTNRWLSCARLESELALRVQRGQIPPPARLLYAGFDELAPAQQNLLGAFRDAGCVVEELPIPAPATPAVARVGLPDAVEELRAAARWARARLEASPEARIGVVVPDLAAVRRAAERIFDDTLHPSLDPARRARRRAFHLSAGPAMTGIPVTAAALAILALGRGILSGADAGLLLRSPFLAGAEREFSSRALLDAELRSRGLAKVPLAVLARVAAGMAPELARRLRGFGRALALVSSRRGASGWSRVFSRLLRVAGWPGDRTPDSSEYQAIERWNDLLSDFAALELVSSPMDYSAALSRLQHLAAGTRFAPADQGAPVQIMGVLEAAGSVFDHLWVAGIEDRTWPAPPHPNPFLPPPLQRSHGVPHSSADRELTYARVVTARLLASAPEVVVSYPLREGDTDLRPSPLIRGFSETTLPLDGPDLIRTLRRSSPGLEEQEDNSGPRLPGGAVERGGMGIIERQAACPFRAFAEFRLGARALEEPSIGFSPQERGKVLHSALEILWGELKSHAALMASTAGELAALLSRSVRRAIAKQVRGRGVESLPHLQSLEQRRLEKLLADWLEIERARSPFEVVASERGRRIPIGGMELDIKVDRVDSLPGGRHVIIDYKTGDPKPGQWEGDRPDAPQLPLYAVTHGAPVGAVAFARLAPGECGFKGLGEDAGIPGVEEYPASKPGKTGLDTLSSHIGHWAQTLESLAREFAEGAAVVAPKRRDTCDHCPLPALCRIGDLPPRMEAEPGPEGADG